MRIQDLNHVEPVQDNVRGGLLVTSSAAVAQYGIGIVGKSSTYSGVRSSYYFRAYTKGSAKGSALIGGQVVASSSIIAL